MAVSGLLQGTYLVSYIIFWRPWTPWIISPFSYCQLQHPSVNSIATIFPDLLLINLLSSQQQLKCCLLDVKQQSINSICYLPLVLSVVGTSSQDFGVEGQADRLDNLFGTACHHMNLCPFQN